MRSGRSIALLCLLAVAATGAAQPAVAQDQAPQTTVVPPVNPLGDALDAPAGGALPEGADPGALPGGGALTPDGQALPPASTTTAPADEAAASGATPTPPPYLAPGPDAAIQPVSSVAGLTEPDIPLEPLRLAAMVAALLGVLLIATATLLRGLGVRGAAAPVVPREPDGQSVFSRARGRVTSLADDIRDFLRHSR